MPKISNLPALSTLTNKIILPIVDQTILDSGKTKKITLAQLVELSAGYDGSKGYDGSLGYTGSIGYAGSASNISGPQGPMGYYGSVGYTGSASQISGPQGPTGYYGSIGYIGSASEVSGPQGPLGYTGSIGYVGSASFVSGPQGPIGYAGSIGYVGSASFVSGPQGPIGYSGSASFVSGPQGPLGYTGSLGAGYNGSQGYVGSKGYVGSIGYVGSAGIESNITRLQSISGAYGAVDHDYNVATGFYHTNIVEDFKANFTNVSTTNNQITLMTLYLEQDSINAFIPNRVQINSVDQYIRWPNGTVPHGVPGGVDVFDFSLLRRFDSWVVIGEKTISYASTGTVGAPTNAFIQFPEAHIISNKVFFQVYEEDIANSAELTLPIGSVKSNSTYFTQFYEDIVGSPEFTLPKASVRSRIP